MEAATIRPLDQPGDLGWVVLAHGEVYAEEFGWNSSFEPMVAQYVSDYASRPDRTRQSGWIAELAGRRVGCVFCEPADPQAAQDETTAKLRMLVVRPEGRGHGLGRRLVRTCVDFARATGYQRMQLWTTDVLTTARQIYVDTGFELIDQQPHRGFGVDLIGMTYLLDLTTSAGHELS